MRREALAAVLLLLAWQALAISDAPDTYETYLQYQSGMLLQPWTVQCDTEPSNPGHDHPLFSCPQGVGTLNSPSYCTAEDTVQIMWRCRTEGDPELGQGYDYWPGGYSALRNLYTINWDNWQSHCTCIGGTWFNNLGTVTSATLSWCCGDDGAGDDWATYWGSLTTSHEVSCRRCLDGGDLGLRTWYGNGRYEGDLANDWQLLCYYGDISCSGAAWGHGASTWLYGNGYVSGNTCYYGDMACADGIALDGDSCLLEYYQICGNGLACESCEPYAALDSHNCRNSCTIKAHCSPGYYCLGGVCVEELIDCAACTADDQCSGSNCRLAVNGSRYCVAAGAACSETDCNSMWVNDIDCWEGNLYQCLGVDTFTLSTNCSAEPSWDSDGGIFPLVAGYVNVYEAGCDGNACAATVTRDQCVSSENISEKTNSSATYTEHIINCSQYDTCASNNRTFVDYSCSSAGLNHFCDWEFADRDSSQYMCEADFNRCGPLLWDIGGDGTHGDCCGNDLGSEFVLNESNSSWWVAPDSDACCNRSDKCVHDSQCYNPWELGVNYHADIGEGDEFIGGSIQNDREICDNGSITGTLGVGTWHDADDSEAYCLVGVSPAGDPLECLNHVYSPSCWVPEGESAPFGGYADADQVMNVSCCGDDQDEFWITRAGMGVCCNSSLAFIYESSPGVYTCSHDTHDVTGYIEEESEDGTFRPSAGAIVKIQDIENGFIINSNNSDSNGNFFVIVPNATYNFIVEKEGFQSYVETITFTADRNFPLIRLYRLQECRQDCSKPQFDPDFKRFQYVCLASCEGINNCSYNSSVLASDGRTMMDACDSKNRGWRLPFNGTHDVMCCNEGYVQIINRTRAEFRLSGGVRDAQTFFLGNYRYEVDGKLFSAYLILFETE